MTNNNSQLPFRHPGERSGFVGCGDRFASSPPNANISPTSRSPSQRVHALLLDQRSLPQQYATTDLGVASFLIAGTHLRLSGTKVAGDRQVLFVFDDPDGSGNELEAEYLAGDALVPGAKFHHQLRLLRRIVEKTLNPVSKSARAQNSDIKH